MSRLAELLDGLRRSRRGITTVEYGLLMALLSLVCILSLSGVSNALLGFWQTAANAFVGH